MLRTLAILLLGTVPALAQPVQVPDCTADVTVHEQLSLDVVYRCRSTQALSFEPAGDRTTQYTREAPSGASTPLPRWIPSDGELTARAKPERSKR